jgi:hypothetical protein
VAYLSGTVHLLAAVSFLLSGGAAGAGTPTPADRLETIEALTPALVGPGGTETPVELEGMLEVLVEDSATSSRELYFLRTGTERLALHFASRPASLLTGERVRVSGVRVGQAIAVSSGARDLTRLSGAGTSSLEALAGTLGEQRTVVLLVNFSDNASQPYTTDYARNVVFTETSNFDLETSYQQTWLTGDVFGWYTIPLSSTICDYSTLATQALAAATADGVSLFNYSHYVFAFPNNACGWWGLGTVGGNPSEAWVNGSLVLQPVGHEMGHNFGLHHSHSLRCGTQSIGGTCTMDEYGDILDMMGYSTYHFSAYQKERLGWLGAGISPPITSVTAGGTYAIDAYETVGSAPKALKIPRGTTGSNYYVELRQGVGCDAALLGNGNVMNGVLVHLASLYDSNSDDLLDMTPGTATFDDAALTAGQTFSDPDYGVTITTLSVGSSGASVAVTLGAPPPPPPPTCAHVAPALTLSPSQSSGVRPGTAVNFTVSLKNNDGSLCTASSFDLEAAVPSGWTATPGTFSFSLAPGKSASKTVKVVSPKSATLGSYAVNMAVANRANTTASSSASATYVISKLH